MKLKIGDKINQNLGYLRDSFKELISSASKAKGISFKNISRVRLCIVIVVISAIYSFYGNSDKCINRQMYIKRQIKKCQNDIDSLNNRIAEYNKFIEQIESSNHFLEEFARKNYYMTNNNEDIIIIERE